MKIIKIFLPLLLLALITACKKNYLDITPDGRITINQVFEKPELTTQYLNTCYESIRLYGINYHYYSMLASFTDESQDPDQLLKAFFPVGIWGLGSMTQSVNAFDQGSNTLNYNDNRWYQKAWEGIRKCNVFLNRISDKVITDPALRSRYISEAKVLRAHYYFDLLRAYGAMPIIDKEMSLDTTNYDKITRNTFQECTDFLVKDCNDAIADPNLPMRTTVPGERGRMTKAIAYTLKSVVTLFNASPLFNPENDQAKWVAAANASNEALTALTTGGYALFPDYKMYFVTAPDISASPNDKETIFEIIGWGRQYAFGQLLYLMNSIPELGPQKAGVCPSQELVDAYEMNNGQPAILGYEDEDHLTPIINTSSGYSEQSPYLNRDPRFYGTVWYNGAKYGRPKGSDIYITSYVGGPQGISSTLRTRTPTGYYLRKFIDSTANSANMVSVFRRFRLAEVYLNLAEAENEANGPTAVAYNAINAIRRRAKMPDIPAGLSKDEFRNRVRSERRVELAIEEHRFYDVRRWKILDKTDKVVTGMEWTKTGNNFSNKRIVTGKRNSWTDKFLLFPIPLSEIKRMPNFKQNPGWE